MYKFFIEDFEINDNILILRDKENLFHMKNVLRFKEGEEIIFSDNEKKEYVVNFKRIITGAGTFEIISENEIIFPEVEVILFQAIPKKKKLETIIQKSVELGVSRIIPFYSEYSEYNRKVNLKEMLNRFQKIAKEAAMQSKAPFIPEVFLPLKNTDRIINFHTVSKNLGIVLYEKETQVTLKKVLQEYNKKSLNIFIGPEGGFSDSEIKIMENAGIKSASLGKNILRTETASIATLSMIKYEYEL